MTKADIVNEISRTTGIEKVAVQATVEAFRLSKVPLSTERMFT